MAALNQVERTFLLRAIELSKRALEDDGNTPFGAVVVIDEIAVSEGTSSVVEKRDATAHAEVEAIRAAGAKLDRHLLPDAIMYASSEPCPMCLLACYWARIPRVVFAATSRDVGKYGFEDLQFYRELTLPAEKRLMIEEAAGGADRTLAVDILRQWASQLPEPVVPKL